MSKFSSHLWKILSQNLKLFGNKKLRKSCGYILGKSAYNFISLYATTELLPKQILSPLLVPLIWWKKMIY